MPASPEPLPERPPGDLHDGPGALVDAVVEKHAGDLVDLRRDLHAHPELSWHEERTTGVVAAQLETAGWRVTRLPGTGLVADLGSGSRRVALRADMDALPLTDHSDDPWASTVPGVAHACGHDVHTAALLGAGHALAEVHATGGLRGAVRLIFQPAEEVMPGGALSLLDRGVLAGVDRIFCLHCDPSVDVGEVGLREGALTGAADQLDVRLVGGGGHTSRPHLTEDLTYAMGTLITGLPAALSRRFDPRAGASVVWGMVRAGQAPNVIPDEGHLAGTVRMLDAVAWSVAEELVRALVDQVVAPYGVRAEVTYTRGVPPVVSDHASVTLLAHAVERVLGVEGHVPTPQSLGGEDFGWYLEHVPGAMGRLGTRTPGGRTYDLHQGDLRVDERAIPIAARVLADVALRTLASGL